MKLLQTEFRKNGYDYKQVWRDEDYAIYTQSSNGFLAYEVFEIKKNKEREMWGQTFEESESVPPSTEWGRKAFTCGNIERCHFLVSRMRQESILLQTADKSAI